MGSLHGVAFYLSAYQPLLGIRHLESAAAAAAAIGQIKNLRFSIPTSPSYFLLPTYHVFSHIMT